MKKETSKRRKERKMHGEEREVPMLTFQCAKVGYFSVATWLLTCDVVMMLNDRDGTGVADNRRFD